MNTLAEIEAAVVRLPLEQQRVLMDFLASRAGQIGRMAARKARRLKAAARPALDGLPPTLSIGTREKVRRLVEKRHTANR